MSADRLNEHESRGRGVYPRAGVEGLRSLNDLDDFKVVDGEPDIRGWDVLGMDGTKAGEVHDLLVDTAAMKVRYMDVELDRDAAGGVKDRHVLVPIGVAQLDDDNDKVRVGQLSAAQLSTMPVYEHGSITREQERELLGRFGTLGAASTAGLAPAALPERDEDFYGHSHFDEAGLRRRGTGGTSADSRYITRSGAELAAGDTARHEVPVERPPVAGDMRADTTAGVDRGVDRGTGRDTEAGPERR